jgi:hypothetical protein
MKRFFILFFSGIFFSSILLAQDTLPNFSVYKMGSGRVLISWIHHYKDIGQISVQRSTDKNNFFKTIITMPDPVIRENGFLDTKAPNDSMYYRLFVMMKGGDFYVTKAQQAIVDSTKSANISIPADNVASSSTMPFQRQEPLYSKYIFTSPDRYIRVELPLDKRKYDIKFFTENNQLLFEMVNVPERKFKLDRSYFISSGYIYFELYADGKLLEKQKFYVPKEL